MALLTPEQDTALAGLSGGLLGLSQALLKAGQGGVPFQRTGLLSGIGQGFAGFGQGAELRQPLGVTIIGGLIASQMLTLLTTPAVYVLLDRLRRHPADERHLARAATA